MNKQIGDGERDGESDNAAFFTSVYVNNRWGGSRSRSGRGSEGDFAANKIALLNGLIAEFNFGSLLDIGCGDMHWMLDVLIDNAHRSPPLRYLGVDIVAPLIERNRAQYEGATCRFLHADLSGADGPQQLGTLARAPYDLIVALDVFGHLLNSEMDALLRNLFASGVGAHLLVTNRRHADHYLRADKTRHEGVDLDYHPVLRAHAPQKVFSAPALYENDVFDLYRLAPQSA